MHDWFRQLDGARGHVGTAAHARDRIGRDPASVRAHDRGEPGRVPEFARLESDLAKLRFDVFADMRRLLRGQDDSVTCVWTACDPYTTRAVRGIEGNGQRSNCGRTYKDGVDFAKAPAEGFERYLALYHTPQDFGGCHGCRFFLMCKGECPGTAIDQRLAKPDEPTARSGWACSGISRPSCPGRARRRSRRMPRRGAVEARVLETWARGANVTVAGVLREMAAPADARSDPANWHGDHTDGRA